MSDRRNPQQYGTGTRYIFQCKVYNTNFISAHVFAFVEGTLRSEQALSEVALSLSLKGEERGGREREEREGGKERGKERGREGEREGGREEGGKEGEREGERGGREAIMLCYLVQEMPTPTNHSPPPTN